MPSDTIESAQSIQVGDRVIGADQPPFIIAELSANHGGDFDRAIRIINGAAEAGADAVKFQAYTADSLTLDSDRNDFLIGGGTLWQGKRLHALYTDAATPYEWFPDLFEHCRNKDLIPFASPFDADAVTMLEELDAPLFKIASFEAVDHGLIEACAKTGKPIIISTGLCTLVEIGDAVTVAREGGCENVVLLHCNSAYPAKDEEANLLSIPELKVRFGVEVGFSDHTLGTHTAAAACALGATVIEKHVIDSPKPPTPDSDFSLTPDALKRLVQDCRAAWSARGHVQDGPTDEERASLAFRRSLYVVTDMKAGEPYSDQNVRSIRPGHGLAPKHLPHLIGKKAARAIERGEALDWSMVDGGKPEE